MQVRPVSKMRPGPLKGVRRLSLNSLTEADIDALLTGEEPLIVEGLDENWPAEYRGAPLRDVAKFAYPPNSVHVDETQRFGVGPEQFFEMLEAGRNVRIFSCALTPEMNGVFALPAKLRDRLVKLRLFRYGEQSPWCFLGGGGAITVMHHDFEFNANWHFVLHGKRRVYLWTHDQSALLFKMPFIGLSAIPFSQGLLDCRFAEGHECLLGPGDLLYMPPGCWHQVEYPEPSMAFTHAYHRTDHELAVGTRTGHFWLGLMTLFQAAGARRPAALLALPLLLPMQAFIALYVPLMFLATLLLRRASIVVALPLRAAESIFFKVYYPLMNFFRRKMYMGF